MVFLSEIVLQSKIARRVADSLSAAYDHYDEIEVKCSIQSFLVAAGNVSKILWPQQKKYQVRGEKLRTLLKVDKNNLLYDRKFRNYFEHYDERIEVWFEEQSSAVYSDLVINPLKSIWGDIPENHHRAFNPLDKTLTFRGVSLDLKAVLNALEEIQLKCSSYTLM